VAKRQIGKKGGQGKISGEWNGGIESLSNWVGGSRSTLSTPGAVEGAEGRGQKRERGFNDVHK